MRYKCPVCGHTMDKIKVLGGFIKERYVWACRHCRTMVSDTPRVLIDFEYKQPETKGETMKCKKCGMHETVVFTEDVGEKQRFVCFCLDCQHAEPLGVAKMVKREKIHEEIWNYAERKQCLCPLCHHPLHAFNNDGVMACTNENCVAYKDNFVGSIQLWKELQKAKVRAENVHSNTEILCRPV